MTELVALLDDRPIGRLRADRHGHPQLVYDDAYRADPTATPLSLALPLAAEQHDSEVVAAVLWGILPDNDRVLQRWASRFQVSARNPLALLAHVGEDCAGAVQFVRPERVDDRLSGADDGIAWLTDDDIAARLTHLREDGSAGREAGDAGQFSLAGAQPKTALYRSPQDGRWGVPRGRVPTSHILKPPTGEYDHYAINEHFCLELARSVDLPTASSSVARFGDEVAICVERYDRAVDGGTLRRVHQEDFCQALAVFPHRKYQNDGGPSPADLTDVLRRHSLDPGADVRHLFRVLVFNWLIVGTDAHAKNYSLLLSAGGRALLAPLYDMSSFLPYPQLNLRKQKLAMRVGGHYRWWEIAPRDWRQAASELGMDEGEALAMVDELAQRLPDHASQLRQVLHEEGLAGGMLDRLVDGIARSAEHWQRFPSADRT
ncbi:MAG TPA: type II toxin-antitoxin system HipA family toxin [Tahibacter sp.]|nr:type II toxin-antitoxin system HipA family toxin [Tahibacter sp.]